MMQIKSLFTVWVSLIQVSTFFSLSAAVSSCVLSLICPRDKWTGVIQLIEIYSLCLFLLVLFAVYLVLTPKIIQAGKAYSARPSSQSTPANINDVFSFFLIAVHRDFRGLCQNKQHALEQKLVLAARHRKAFLCTFKTLKAGFLCVLSTLSITSSGWIIVAVSKKEDNLEVKHVLALILVFRLLSKQTAACVLFQLTRQDWNKLCLLTHTSRGLLLLECQKSLLQVEKIS